MNDCIEKNECPFEYGRNQVKGLIVWADCLTDNTWKMQSDSYFEDRAHNHQPEF